MKLKKLTALVLLLSLCLALAACGAEESPVSDAPAADDGLVDYTVEGVGTFRLPEGFEMETGSTTDPLPTNYVVFEKDGVTYRIVSRVYDDGMAFQYQIEGQDGEELTISSEATGFLMPDGSIAQTMDFDKANEERYYQKEIEELEGGYCMPLLYETENGDWALLSEAALTPQYSGGQIVGHDSGMLDAGAVQRHRHHRTVCIPVALHGHRRSGGHCGKHVGRNLEPRLRNRRYQLDRTGCG